MRSEMLSQEKNIITIKAVVEVDDFAKEITKTYQKLSRNASIPGFRRGKAPRKVLDLRFGKDAILAEALEALLPNILESLTTDYDLKLIEDPDVKVDVMEEGKDAEITVVFEVEPEVTLAELADITVTQPKLAVTEVHVNEAVENLRKKHAVPTSVDRPSELGDLVIAQYATTVLDDEGEVLVSHDAEEHRFELNEKTLRPEIREALVGVSPSDERDADVQIDENYHDTKLAGRTARYHFTVSQVNELVLPELDSEFFGVVFGDEGREMDLSAFRERIGQQLREHMEAESRQSAEHEMVFKAVQNSEVDLPHSMVKRQIENINKRLDEQEGDRPEEKQIVAQAERDVKEFVVLDAYGTELGVELSKDDMEEEFQRLAGMYGVQSEMVRNAFTKDREKLSEIVHSVKTRKTIGAMMEKVTIEEKELPEGDPKE
ncbi:MAG: trigger factor [Dethiosulfovibrio peptidovorans]|nr:MAG: trigger factor [Dethiosulfovibrio peptidovorans]